MDSHEFPSKAALTSDDPDVREGAWELAYPILWSEGMKLANRRLGVGSHQDREDVVVKAICDYQPTNDR